QKRGEVVGVEGASEGGVGVVGAGEGHHYLDSSSHVASELIARWKRVGGCGASHLKRPEADIPHLGFEGGDVCGGRVARSPQQRQQFLLPQNILSRGRWPLALNDQWKSRGVKYRKYE